LGTLKAVPKSCLTLTRRLQKDKQRLLTELKGLRLEVERSCRLLGVWDQSGKLAENQCYVTYRHAGDVSQLIGKVVIMKNPTVHLGGKSDRGSIVIEPKIEKCHQTVH
jgi:hypothetical protein